MPQPESFFWAGLLTAIVPMMILGGLGALVVYLYFKERARSDDESGRPG